MVIDYGKLRGKIIEVFGSQSEFSKAIGLSERTVSLKINSKIPWKQSEILNAVKLLHLKEGDIPEYFFTLKVQNIEQKKQNNIF